MPLGASIDGRVPLLGRYMGRRAAPKGGLCVRAYTASNSALMLASRASSTSARILRKAVLGRYPVFKADGAEHGSLKALHTSHRNIL